MNKTSTDNKKYLKALGGHSITDGSVDGILMTCLVIKEAKETLTDESFRDLRSKWDVSEKVWSKLLQIGLDQRLEGIKKSLPPKYTTIHQIHCLSDEELNEAIKDGVINPSVSQGSLTKWIKSNRLKGTEQEVPDDFIDVATVLAPELTSQETLERFKNDLQKLIGVYGFRTQTDSEQTSVAIRQQRNTDRSKEVIGILIADLKSTWEQSDQELRTQFSINSLEDLVESPLNIFTGFLNKVRSGRDGFWSFHSNDYIHKIALEYLKTPSRGQRFNYKKRLKEVVSRFPHLDQKVNDVLQKWINY